MFKNLLSLYYHRYPKALVSLMYASEYRAGGYLRKLHKTQNYFLPLKKPLPKTKKTRTAVVLLSLGMLIQVAIGILVIILGITNHISGGIFFGVAIILLYPFVWAYLSALGLVLREWGKTGYGLGKAS